MMSTTSNADIGVEEANPLKQGLKLKKALEERVPDKVEEANPLKQGLKPFVISCITTVSLVSKRLIH